MGLKNAAPKRDIISDSISAFEIAALMFYNLDVVTQTVSLRRQIFVTPTVSLRRL